jgi:hypothetical protein
VRAWVQLLLASEQLHATAGCLPKLAGLSGWGGSSKGEGNSYIAPLAGFKVELVHGSWLLCVPWPCINGVTALQEALVSWQRSW